MNASSPHVPTDAQPESPSHSLPLAEIATAIAGAAVTSAPAVAAIHKTVRSTVAVVQPTLTGWLRVAAGLFRFSG